MSKNTKHTETTSHCDGCDDLQHDVKTYLALFTGAEGWERVRYCPDCYDLAQMNWNGETEAIAPTSGDETGADFNARVKAALAKAGLSLGWLVER